MIVKEKTEPIRLLQYEALLRRLPPVYFTRDEIEEQMGNIRAGYKGEQSINYHLNFLEQSNYSLFHDLRLQDGLQFFQIDALFQFSTFILLLEIKNIAGILTVTDATEPLFRMKNDAPQSLTNPLLQINRHEAQFRRWLRQRKLSVPPIVSLVVNANYNSRFITVPGKESLLGQVIHVESIPDRIGKLVEGFASKRAIRIVERRRLAEALVDGDSPNYANLLLRHRVDFEQLIKGVQCEKCGHFGMKRVSHTWRCPVCHVTSKIAHHQAFRDYRLLVGPTISNREAREFMRVDSQVAMKNIMKELGYSYEGKTHKLRYRIPDIK